MTDHIKLRPATAADADLLFHFITALAIYEKEPDAVKVTSAQLAEQLKSDSPPFECILASLNRVPAGFALFFHNYSTWRGQRGLYLEDLFVDPACRGHGIGRQLLAHLAALAVQRGCARMEWSVLDWNTLAIDFYRGLGAAPMVGWSTWRLTGEALEVLAAKRHTAR